MTANEIYTRFEIPQKILDEYHEWGLCDAVRLTMEDWKYTDQDIERLSMIMALHDIGFSNIEVEAYMKLLLQKEDTQKERMEMLNELRKKALDEIHLRELKMMRMDYLRKEIRDNLEKNKGGKKNNGRDNFK